MFVIAGITEACKKVEHHMMHETRLRCSPICWQKKKKSNNAVWYILKPVAVFLDMNQVGLFCCHILLYKIVYMCSSLMMAD